MTFNKYEQKKIHNTFDDISEEKAKEILFELLDRLNLQVIQHYKNGYETHITLEPKEE